MNDSYSIISAPNKTVQGIHSRQDKHCDKESLQANLKWYVVQTYSCREKVVDKLLKDQGICSFLPLITEKHRWSDRLKTIHIPLFPNYLFVHIDVKGDDYYKVSYSHSVCRILRDQTGPISVFDYQITDIKRMIDNKSILKAVRGLYRGQRVIIKSGPLKGMTGEYIQTQDERYLAIHISILGQTVLVKVNHFDVQPD